ncbi:hypothetical protein N781_16160 [Pontibacillus halophilus JSM 076056 = DSM 19796]|uniref:Lipoprotein n=1 Tax=Pontibacillus halophilus JSM 076056 = DSM 19796 TaxID=1385510 RepID=A0A0A5GGW8_9BACI|nr:hypothetical protein [Pontibacillus halophilus]KGX92476.1 hypothetical protein N781_16160 [Pontibacillus halophilus JSM 076056 = DSM 19796]
MEKAKWLVVPAVLVSLIGISACSETSDVSTSVGKQSESEVDSISTGVNSQSKETSANKGKESEQNEGDSGHASEGSETDVDRSESEEPSAQDSTNTATTSSNEEEPSKTKEASVANEAAHLSDEDTQNASQPSEKASLPILSGEEAVNFLKQQLPEGKDEDISFGAEEVAREDENGSYYAVQLVSISTRVSGKTGTLGYYKVYKDGEYEKF